jgi:hypothetical protein
MRSIIAHVQLKKICGRESQGAWHRGDLIGGKLPVALTLTVAVRSW